MQQNSEKSDRKGENCFFMVEGLKNCVMYKVGNGTGICN